MLHPVFFPGDAGQGEHPLCVPFEHPTATASTGLHPCCSSREVMGTSATPITCQESLEKSLPLFPPPL